jgi:hypothetical protein
MDTKVSQRAPLQQTDSVTNSSESCGLRCDLWARGTRVPELLHAWSLLRGLQLTCSPKSLNKNITLDPPAGNLGYIIPDRFPYSIRPGAHHWVLRRLETGGRRATALGAGPRSLHHRARGRRCWHRHWTGGRTI